MSKSITVQKNAQNASVIARAVDENVEHVELGHAMANERAELEAQVAPALAERRNSTADANASTAARREYKPRESILPTPELRARAAHAGPLFFMELVQGWERVDGQLDAACPDNPVRIVGMYDDAPRQDGNGMRRVPSTPYAFVNALARRVARGEAFLEDISFDQTVAKGGTLAEWAFNAARYVYQQGEKGSVPRGALSADLRSALGSSGAANGTPSSR